ncbi:HupE/UreJ family protein [Bradyrhizobium sp. Ash2021]|uniref:HupE/UreJ family protein n=1 Tax=Bradyrhizobium sp. Ash2021 TaxID=2954771 RepID=UPI0028159B51|nr:HupE/UreJ family protein [Bradyrhizobium sp. Ash2021]WMT71287.1 HupE/UreJ family protein [Bradyrhizobium sp. Ash2021]
MTARLMRWAALWLALNGCGDAVAHVTTTGLLRIEFAGDRILYALSVALPELPAASAAILTAAANGDRAAAETVAEAARRSVMIDVAGGRCRTGRVRIGGAGANETRATVEIDFTCDASHGRLDITEDWSAFLGEHYQTLGNLRTPSGERQVTFGEASRTATVDIDRTAATGWFDFIELGIKHILTGYDHLLFLVALLATARNVWSVVRIVTAFTLAHSVTLSVATMGIVTVPGRIIEPLIAATIVWVALENLFAAEPDRGRWIWSFGFGLVHGLGFASALGELGLKGAMLVRGLVGFNLGVEIGQLLFVAVFLPALMWLTRGRGAQLTPRIASLTVATIGTYWLVERIFVD